MKTKHFILTALVSLMIAGAGAARGATNEVSALLQKGLFEEEANHNLEAAIQAYQAVVTQTEKDRQFAATAIFRLGECYRKLGRTNEANVQYQRIVKEFSDQTELAKLSQSYVGSPVTGTTDPMAKLLALRSREAQDDQQAAETAELKRIQAMIKDSPDLINGQGGQNIPLVSAATQNYLVVAKFLLDNKADVNVNSGLPLGAAVEGGHKEMVELLADRGADVNLGSVDAEGHGPLLEAALKGYKAIAEVLLAHKADVNIRDRNGETPLHLASRIGFLSIAELLLANGADVNAPAEDGQTPLHFAASADRTAIMEMLLTRKADVNARARDGTTPLMTAVLYSQAGAARLLMEHGANVNAARTDAGNFRDWMPLHFAVYHDEPELAKLLLENKADVNARVPIYPAASPVSRAGRGFGGGGGLGRGGPRTTPLGSPGGNPGSYADVTPLAATVIGWQPKIAQFLLDHQANINTTDKDADTPLSLAAKLNRLDMAELLLAHGATVQTLNNDHWSPLSLAVYDRSVDMVKLLLAHKPDLEVTDKEDFTPLQRAVLNNDVNVVGLLLDAGAFVDSRYKGNYNGLSPLGWAVLQRQMEMVKLLLAHQANPNFQDKSGNTPLSFAKQDLASNGHDSAANRACNEIIDLLQKAGANDNLQRLTQIGVSRNGAGQRVFQKGTNDYNHYTLFELLAQHYAPAGWTPNGSSVLPGLAFPDLTKIKISRLDAKGRTNSISVNLEVAFDSSDGSKDVSLEWGDIVEIPESDHKVNEVWHGLTDPVQRTLKACLGSHIAIVVKNRTNDVTLVPIFFENNGNIAARVQAAATVPNRLGPTPPMEHWVLNAKATSFWLYDVVRAADVLLTSSDLSRVKVRRVDPASRKTVEMIFNLEKDDSQNRLWLRDGDVIEVPEK